jgi:hypothetical protein
MRGTTVLLAAFALVTAPGLGAQEYTWSADRPDAVAPVGITNDRTLGGGNLELAYRFGRSELTGLKFGNQIFDVDDALELFTFIPIEGVAEAHVVHVGYGVDDDLSITATGGWLTKTRSAGNEEVFFSNQSSGMTDIELDVLWQAYAQGAWRSHLQMGLVIPTGSVDETGDFPASGELGEATGVQLPYNMQIGTGAWALVPGVTAQVMNEVGSVGGQVRAVFALADNDRGWRPGTRVDANLWAGYRFNDFVSASAGVRMSAMNAIQGVDPDLETLRDPGDLALSFAGERVDLPLGVNLRMTEGPLAGHRLSIESVWTVHEEFDGPALAADWGFNIGWSKEFGLGSISLGGLGDLMPF